MYTKEYCSAMKNEVLIHAKMWMNFENIMLNKISQTHTKKVLYDYTYMKSQEQTNS